MPFLAQYAAAFLTLHIALGPDAPPPRLTYSYCGSYFNGPRGWAETRNRIDTDFARYSRGLQTDQCDLLGREIQAHFSF